MLAFLLFGWSAARAGDNALLPPHLGLFWDGPSLLAPPAPLRSAGEENVDGMSVGARTFARRGLEGGASPGFRLSMSAWQIEGATGDSSWGADAALGRVDAGRAVDWDSLDARWDATRATTESVRFHAGRRWRVEGAVRQDEHGIELDAKARAPIGDRSALVAWVGQADLSGSLSLTLHGYPSLVLASRSRIRTWGGGLELRDPFGSEWSLEAVRRWMTPRSAGDTARLEAEGSSVSWTAAWTKRFEAMDIALFGEWRRQTGEATTKGLVGSDPRRFHAQDWSAAGDAAKIGARHRRGSIVLHGFEFRGMAPRGRFSQPFLAWNTLDASPWAPMRQLLSNRNDHLDAELRLRRAGASGCARIAWRRLAAEAGADISWWAVDGRARRVATTISILPFEMTQTVEILAAPRWRVIALQPQLSASLDLGSWGSLRGAAEAIAPLHARKLSGGEPPPSRHEPGSALGEQAYSGLWTASGGWFRAF